MVLQLFRECVCQASEAALLHPERQILSFNVRDRNPRRGAYYVSHGYGYYGGGRIAPRSFYGRLYRIMLLDCAEGAFDAERSLNGIGIRRKPIRRNFRRAQDAGAELRGSGSYRG